MARPLALVPLLALALLLGPATPAAADPGDSTLFPNANVQEPGDLVLGPDGNFWFTSGDTDRIGRITPQGQITTYPGGPGEVSDPRGITVGPDGRIWWVNLDSIGRLNPAAANPGSTIVAFPDLADEILNPADITSGPGNALWFTSFSNNRIGRITTAGAITTFNGAGEIDGPAEIVALGGNVYFSQQGQEGLGRASASGAITNLDDGEIGEVRDVTIGPDGRVWFVDQDHVGYLIPGNPFFALVLFDCGCGSAIGTGPDGNLWLGRNDASFVRVTPWGGSAFVDNGGVVDDVNALVAGPNNTLWVSSRGSAHGIGRVRTFPRAGFVDVGANAFFADGVDWLRFEELINGFPDDTYRPDDAVNRGQIVNILWNLADAPTGFDPHGFSDVPGTAFYDEALDWAKAAALVNGFPGNLFKPADPVKRGQLVNMLWNLAGSPTGSPDHGFADVPDGAFYEDGLDWATDHELVSGFPGNLFKPNDPVKRGQLAAILYNLARNPAAWDFGEVNHPSTLLF